MFAWLVWIAFLCGLHGCVTFLHSLHDTWFIIIIYLFIFIFFIIFYNTTFIHLFNLIILCFCREPNPLEKEESPWAWDDTKDAISKMVKYQIWLACENEGFWKIPDCALTWKGVGFSFGGLLVRFTRRHMKIRFFLIGRGSQSTPFFGSLRPTSWGEFQHILEDMIR